MNENYIKEYEEMSLCDFADELIEPLSTIKQDLTKTIYIHYAKERDENEHLQKQNKELKDNWNKLKEWLEEEKIRLARECSNIYEDDLGKTKLVNEDIYNELNNVLDKMQEIEGGMNE